MTNANPVQRLLSLPREDRLKIYPSLNAEERYALKNLLDNEISNPWLRFENDPVGFVTQGYRKSLRAFVTINVLLFLLATPLESHTLLHVLLLGGFQFIQ